MNSAMNVINKCDIIIGNDVWIEKFRNNYARYLNWYGTIGTNSLVTIDVEPYAVIG